MLKPLAAIAVALLAGSLPICANAELSESLYEYVAANTSAAEPATQAPTATPDAPAAEAPAEKPPADSAPVEKAKSDDAAKTASESKKATDSTSSDSSSCGSSCESCAGQCGCGESCGCGDACSPGSSPYCCSSLENLSLRKLLGVGCCPGWEVGGWTEAGYTNNNVPLSQAFDDLLSFEDLPDQVNLNQQWFYLGKKADGSCGADWGFRVDMMYGTDAQKTQSFGNPNAGIRGEGAFDASWDNGYYGWAMPQLYGEVAAGDTSVKVGHFLTPLGYEAVPATSNFFYTHSYTFFNSEPFTHTGVLATNKSYDGLTLYGGWTLGWDTGYAQLNSGNNGLAGFAKELNDNTTFTYICTFGNFGWRDGGSKNSYQHSIVLDMKLTSNLEWVLQSDDVSTSNPNVSDYDTIGAVNYLFYKINDKVKFGSRTEWWKADGVSFYEATLGPNINLAKNFVVRPEWRQDWAPGIGLDEDTFGIDAILTY